MTTPSDENFPIPLRFVDFAVRAWREGKYVQVIAHATPAGNMRQPVAVSTGRFSADDYRLPLEANLEEGVQLGRDLTRLLLPREVWALLSESMMLIAPEPNLGLRLRLCLDEDLIESVVRFASVSRFVVADLTDPKSIPAELQAIVPNFPSLPVSLIIQGSQREYAVSEHIVRRESVVGKRVVSYRNLDHLLSILDEQVLARAGS